jgi:hypothetical protein
LPDGASTLTEQLGRKRFLPPARIIIRRNPLDTAARRPRTVPSLYGVWCRWCNMHCTLLVRSAYTYCYCLLLIAYCLLLLLLTLFLLSQM